MAPFAEVESWPAMRRLFLLAIITKHIHAFLTTTTPTQPLAHGKSNVRYLSLWLCAEGRQNIGSRIQDSSMLFHRRRTGLISSRNIRFRLHMAATTPNQNSNDPFQILGLDPATSAALDKKEIKRAYKRLALQYHPDVVITKDSTAAEKKHASDRFAKINWAYETLSGKRQDSFTYARGSSGATSSSSSSSTPSSSSSDWTPPHRRAGSYSSASSSSSSGSSTPNVSTDWRDYIPNYGNQYDDNQYDAEGDSFGAIFNDLMAEVVGAGARASSSGGGVFRDFVDFLENNLDGYSNKGSAGSAADDAELTFLLQTGSVDDIGDEMDETELVMQQLVSKSKSMDDELLMLKADIASVSRYTEKLAIEERIAELEARKNVVESYRQKANKRLLTLQIRYKELVVRGQNDSRAGGGARSSSFTSTESASQRQRPPPGTSSTYAGRSPSTSTSSERATDSDRRHDDDAWKAASFGSFGRGRGSSRRRSRPGSDKETQSGRNVYSGDQSWSTKDAAKASSRWDTSSSSSPRPPAEADRQQFSSQPESSRKASSSSSSSSPSSSNSYVPPHRRQSYSSRMDDDKRRLRDLKVDEEFDKLKKELGL